MSSQHYLFAHRALPSVLFRDPAWTLGVLGGPDGERFVRDLWAQAGARVPPEAQRPADGLAVQVGGTGGNGLIASVHLPPPREITEAYRIAIVAKVADPSAPSLDRLEYLRYFTLELGHDLAADRPCTFLGEWTRDGKHRNLGIGPAVDEDAFIRAIFEVLQREQPPAQA